MSELLEQLEGILAENELLIVKLGVWEEDDEGPTFAAVAYNDGDPESPVAEVYSEPSLVTAVDKLIQLLEPEVIEDEEYEPY